jgi:hypothetical protein
MTPSYRPPALVAGSTNPADSNGGGTACLKWPIAVQASQASTSARMRGTDLGLIGIGGRGR